MFEPKENPLAAHDVKIRGLAGKLSEGGHWFTVTQLWYAAARKANRSAQTSGAGCGMIGLIVVGVVLLGVGFAGPTALAVVGGLLILVAATLLVLRRSGVWKHAVAVRMPLDEFRQQVVSGWTRVYGGLPAGLVDERQVRPGPPPANPAFAVLSPDHAVLTCLRVNDVERRYNAALAAKVGDLPPGTPVAVIHDASVEGELFLAQARHELPGRRVIDVGLRPSAVLAAKGSFRLRTTARHPERIAWLRANTTLTPAELAWLGEGWWAPAATLRPGQLIARVEKAAAAAGRSGDPDQRAAAAVGFMTWPAE
ncbi:hypothetical protein KZZ52_43595 [Dactylosporangium sp. AC04546]|uniref:hypothetical protein n=1 Tax=Dactylosporangium sp. AC04546 TaxID=2862460 RepID=UPI002E7B11C8|nr:hypothetical protein [Dactylosporangium sp. AC04546]WVK80799.1 hypothetical protein KZZ52_43595 [Dactylosporangium sp. AC04546]